MIDFLLNLKELEELFNMCKCNKTGCSCGQQLSPPSFIDYTKPVQTKEGRKVRILCTNGPHKTYPVIGIVPGQESIPACYGKVTGKEQRRQIA
jgi:hypothetical protein